ncbi:MULTISPECIES: sugar 3,4-ketoisomerase [Pseudoalteromonas]|uniref:dTDP-6-deoxy-3,4-keto-hexulose isomerase n=1 Tax=Pseudoalteromonas amylolytica TaxID=1859457 RepID=A0A1S1MUW8_9GAMM|nr:MULTISPECIES: FdtA/QdtA family cupin domain-containing protein [Pseudoalteromonas]OHU90685.1 dTDP-6-deoxy-3,4-keto-hexulose isomerase [Pseudoalteromonas sp. JW3]OHU92695.1 dTDP-6-deoxy-3,4-keto-hexulose isomerase [Pseudoalteromonas amylolytica]
MSIVNLLDLQVFDDDRGSLVALESLKNIPFDIKRVYYIFDTLAGGSRGYHAHKDLQQIAVCLSGSCRFILDDGKTKESVVLDSPRQGLHIGSMVWREMHDFSNDCVLLVLASEHYSEDDYIRNYSDFIGAVSSER